MKRKFFALLFALIFILIQALPFAVSAEEYDNEENLSSKYAAVYNTKTGSFVYTLNAEEKTEPASTAKIITAIIALEYFEGELDTVVTVTSAALKGLEGSSVLNLKSGEEIPVIDLIYATLIAGMNDAANALAIAISGSILNFVTLMNDKAEEIGAENTLYLNPTGLSSSAYTTAEDTAIIAAYAYENKLFMEICNTRAYQVTETNKNPAVTIYTRNALLTPQSDYFWTYAEGMSYGYTETGGYAVVSAASYGTYPYICVAMGSEKDTSGTIGGYLDIKSLLSWASNNFAERKVLDKSKILCELPVRAGDDVGHVLIVPSEAVYAFLDVDIDLSRITLSEELRYNSLTAPVEKGTVVGTVTISLDGNPIGYTELITKTSVRRSALGSFLLTLESIVTNKFFIIFVMILVIAAIVFFTAKYSLLSKKANRSSHYKNHKNIK